MPKLLIDASLHFEGVNRFSILEDDGVIGEHMTSVQIAFAIAGPIIVLCVLFMICYVIYGKRSRLQKGVLRVEDSVDDPDHPILGANSIRDMMEMTTSGSGSGTLLISALPNRQLI